MGGNGAERAGPLVARNLRAKKALVSSLLLTPLPNGPVSQYPPSIHGECFQIHHNQGRMRQDPAMFKLYLPF
eukprot:scaffold2442_cov146-Cylindrotheca_fusiformis.AAC.21